MCCKILVMGLPGNGKTTLASALAKQLSAVHFNADRVRNELYLGSLGFSMHDRIEHARRMGWLCDRVVESGHVAVGDLVCPTEQTRQAFGNAFVVWMDRNQACPYPDTCAMFKPPSRFDVRITEGSVEAAVQRVQNCLISKRKKPLLDVQSSSFNK